MAVKSRSLPPSLQVGLGSYKAFFFFPQGLGLDHWLDAFRYPFPVSRLINFPAVIWLAISRAKTRSRMHAAQDGISSIIPDQEAIPGRLLGPLE